MKKNFEEPVVEIVAINEDIITTSICENHTDPVHI